PCIGLIDEMVEHPYRIQPVLLGRSREGSDLGPAGSFAVAVRFRSWEDHADLHAAESRRPGSRHDRSGCRPAARPCGTTDLLARHGVQATLGHAFGTERLPEGLHTLIGHP